MRSQVLRGDFHGDRSRKMWSDEEFPGDGDEGELLRFAGGDQAELKIAGSKVDSHGGSSRRIEHASYPPAAAANATPTAMFAAVVGKRRQARQGGRLAVRDAPQLR